MTIKTDFPARRSVLGQTEDRCTQKCCGEVVSPPPGPAHVPVLSGLVPGPVQQSNGPTALHTAWRGDAPAGLSDGPRIRSPRCGVTDVQISPVSSMAQDLDEPDDRSGAVALAPDVEAFLKELCLGLPRDYGLTRERDAIWDCIHGTLVCGPLRVVSFPRRTDHTGWSVEVEFLDRDGKLQRSTFAQIELVTRSGKFVAGLVDRGLAVHASAASVAQLLGKWRAVGHSWRVDGPGWFAGPEGRMSFVQPDGQVHQPKGGVADPIALAPPRLTGTRVTGSLQGWQDEVAARALGNPALIFAISAAVTGPLLRPAGVDTAGFNFFGPPSVGKSLLLRMALSCSGDPARLVPWTAAHTGLHRLSTEAQDGLLPLDGFPRDPDARLIRALLALADDAGAGRTDPARDPDGGSRFRRIVLSTSELPLATSLRRKKKDPPAALALRMIDIPADHGCHGLVGNLQGHADGAAFARSLERSMRRHHGHLLPAFLDRLIADLDQVTADLSDALPRLSAEMESLLPAQETALSGALSRIAERFALVSHAGELAIAFGLLSWPAGTAREAAGLMAHLARPDAQSPVSDAGKSIEAFRGYIERNRDRIIDLGPDRPAGRMEDALGWRDEEHVYLRSEPIRDELAELDAMLDALADCGALKPGGEARSLQYKLPATKVRSRPRVYRVDRTMIEGNSG